MRGNARKYIVLAAIPLYALVVAIISFIIGRDTCSWSVGIQSFGALVALGVMVVALLKEIIIDWYKKPEVRVRFLSDRPCIARANIGGKERIWIRAIVTNSGNSVAKSCEARLEKLFAITDREEEVREHIEKLFLPWVGYPHAVEWPKRDREFIHAKEWMTINVGNGMDALFDLCYIDVDKRRIVLVTSVEWQVDVQWERPETKLRFWVSVYGQNFEPVSKRDIVIDLDKILSQFEN